MNESPLIKVKFVFRFMSFNCIENLDFIEGHSIRMSGCFRVSERRFIINVALIDE